MRVVKVELGCEIMPGSNVIQFLKSCRPVDKGFVTLDPNRGWRVGTILFGMKGETFAAVRKAPAEGGAYEFEDKWALPGGMVRASDAPAAADSPEVLDLTRDSLRNRAEREAGLTREKTGDLQFSDRLGPVVTSYTAKGNRQFTLVIAQFCHCAPDAGVAPGDHSIQDARWFAVPPDWSTFAPANRLILAHLLWGRLDDAQRRVARPAVSEALSECRGWAAEVGVGAPAAPWDDEAELVAWRAGFPAAEDA